MNTNHYEYFLKIVECRSISRAAEQLYISQPSLTKYLQRLESSIGETLFDRKQYPIKLTCAGQHYYEYVKKLEAEELKLKTKIFEIKNMGRGNITIGMPLWRSSVLLPEFLPLFSQKYPLIRVNLKEGSSTSIENALMSGEIDIGFLNLPINYASLAYETIAKEYILLACSKENIAIQGRFSQSEQGSPYPNVDIRDLADQPFILTQPGQHITDYVNAMISARNLELDCVFRTANVSTAVNLAAANMGFTFVPEIGIKSKFFPRNDVALFTVNTPPFRATLTATYKKTKYLSNTERLFISELRNFCNDAKKENG